MFDVNFSLKQDDFDLSCQFKTPNGITVVTGPSGAGKSTLASAIVGLRRPDSGRVAVNSRTLFDHAAKADVPTAQRRAGYVLQDALLFPHRTVRGNLRYGSRKGPFAFDEVVTLLELKSLLNRRPRTLSGGEQQRVAIGRALLSQPTFLVMDEPLAGLDRARRDTLMAFLQNISRRQNLPILYISHNWPEIVRLSDSLVLMDLGKVVAHGPAADVLGKSAEGALLPAGAIVEAELAARLQDGLARLVTEGGAIYTPAETHEVGEKVRVFIDARDVALALEEPKGLSIQNVLQGQIVRIRREGTGSVDVHISLPDGQVVRAQITGRAYESLGLEPGKPIFALIKTVALDRDIGMENFS